MLTQLFHRTDNFLIYNNNLFQRRKRHWQQKSGVLISRCCQSWRSNTNKSDIVTSLVLRRPVTSATVSQHYFMIMSYFV